MDKESFWHIYEEIYDSSKDGVNAFRCKAFEDRLAEAGLGAYLDHMDVFIRIQLESEAFQRDMREVLSDAPDAPASDHQRAFLSRKINGFLSSFSPIDQKAILFNMVLNARRLSGKAEDPHEDLKLTLKGKEALEYALIDEIVVLSADSLDLVKDFQLDMAREATNQTCSKGFSSDAVACAAYVSFPGLISNPCLCGALAGGAALIHEFREDSGRTRHIGAVFVGLASVLFIFLLVLFLGAVGTDYLGEVITEGAESITAESFRKNTVIPFFQNFGIVILCTIEVGGCLISAFAKTQKADNPMLAMGASEGESSTAQDDEDETEPKII